MKQKQINNDCKRKFKNWHNTKTETQKEEVDKLQTTAVIEELAKTNIIWEVSLIQKQ